MQKNVHQQMALWELNNEATKYVGFYFTISPNMETD